MKNSAMNCLCGMFSIRPGRLQELSRSIAASVPDEGQRVTKGNLGPSLQKAAKRQLIQYGRVPRRHLWRIIPRISRAGAWMREPERFNAPYFRHLMDRTGRILEFGSGTGMLTVPLARAGYWIDSVDISPFMQDVLARKLARRVPTSSLRVNQVTADATSYRVGSQPLQFAGHARRNPHLPCRTRRSSAHCL